ncbi:MAG: ABC transporter substrate-binding protein [Gammaproteobacteria bacterium]|nr:ABC transporter substrate-binding protein [Gammaproteobacteria bacterium]
MLSASVWANEALDNDNVWDNEAPANVDSTNGVAEKFGTAPVLNDGRKWRIVFYEGGPHANYYHYLDATVRGLMKLGWIEKSDLKDVQSRRKDTKRLWNWLAKDAQSDYLEFVEDGYYSANWDDDQRKENRSRLIKRLRSDEEINLVIAMGTWAGLDLANDEHSVPTIVMSTSDPVESGIIKSQDDSGYDHVHARVDPYRYERQLRIFYDIIKFKKLGIAFEDSIYGRSYSAIDTVEKVAADIGFEVVKCYTKSDISDTDTASESVIKCFDELSKEVDAIYVTIQGGVNTESIPRLVEIANKNSIPTFSQLGSKEVEQGFLFSISRPGFKPAGLFLSATIAQILNGAHPRQLKQVFEETPSIAINLKTAEIVGLYLYADILAAADTIYRDIKTP